MSLDRLTSDEQRKLVAWQACGPALWLDRDEYREDAFGNLVAWSEYGKQSSCGWEIDHAHPTAFGGPDTLSNLRGLHWRANRSLGGLMGNALKEATEPKGLFQLGNALASMSQPK